jgi:Spy/CpxP family protein refolding chaperone
MSHENGDDPEDEPKTYRDYQIAKNLRASKPEENDDPMDPAADYDGVGSDDWQADVARGLLEDLPDHKVKDADGRTLMETALDALGPGMVSKDTEADGSGEGVTDLSWTREDIEQVKMSGEEKRLALLEDIRDRLDALDHPTPAARKAAEKALTRADTQGTGEDIQTLTDRTLDQLEALEGALEGEEQAEMLEDALNAYVEAASENGLEDSLADVVARLREQADGMEDPEEGRRVTDALDRLPDTGGASA